MLNTVTTSITLLKIKHFQKIQIIIDEFQGHNTEKFKKTRGGYYYYIME